VCAVLNVHKHI